MLLLAAWALGKAAVAVGGRHGRGVRRPGGRLAELLPGGPAHRGPPSARPRAGRLGLNAVPATGGVAALLRNWLPAVGTAAAGPFLLGGAAGWALGLLGGCVVRVWWQRRPATTPDREKHSEESDGRLPFAGELLAACLAAGAGPVEAADAVGSSLGGPVGEGLARAAAELRLGGDPGVVWGRFAELPGALALASALQRAQATGVPAVEPVARLAAEYRSAQARRATAAARRAGVLATAPLGLCFLPAFLTVGVAPVLIGLGTALLRGA
ncbi:type II secretion system F family protein [Streptomyces sp. TP-A0874]|uniref:type II secretion system F family protein n=1 Tax=Streptomyces sp. TP-A0874 TaxID=549819 RepID=UPI001FCD058B|nr:type II secretion system F family protein [Streptomyces sp. TP-A0874]